MNLQRSVDFWRSDNSCVLVSLANPTTVGCTDTSNSDDAMVRHDLLFDEKSANVSKSFLFFRRFIDMKIWQRFTVSSALSLFDRRGLKEDQRSKWSR